jgi:hypothetical protein
MVSARHDVPTRSAKSPAFTNGFLIRGALLVVCETRLASEMSITFGAGDSAVGEGARGARHTIAIRLVTHVRNVSTTPFVTCFTHVPSSHGSLQFYDHMIVSFDIIVEDMNSLRGVDLPFKHYVFIRQALIDSYLILPKLFLEFD